MVQRCNKLPEDRKYEEKAFQRIAKLLNIQ